MTQDKFVAYYRVSTKRQGQSGLGLEAQEKAVMDFLNGGEWQLIESFTEVESGKRDDRPELAKATKRCKLTGARLVIAKIDRLTRDPHFLWGLQKAGVDFVAADMPHANKLTVGIMALVAEQEREAISARTKAALAAAKERGVKLGNPNGAKHLKQYGNQAAVAAIKAKAQERATDLQDKVLELQSTGLSVRGIAGELNRQAIMTARGGSWGPSSVHRLLERLAM